MRLKFESVNYKNFLSTGNQPITIMLDHSPTTLVYGVNGDGKSTFYEAIYFGLYGKPFRDCNKPDLVNNINLKNTVVTVNFTVNNDKFSVIRGIKPNIFEIRRNEKLIDQGSNVNDYQKMLEQTILRMTSATFLQVVVLGSSLYTPFMKLSTMNRRKIVEELFDITIFSSMNVVTKKRNVELGKDKVKLDQEKEVVESAITIMKNHFDSVVKKQAELVKKGQIAIKKKEKEITEIEKKSNKHKKVLQKLETQTKDVTDISRQNISHNLEINNKRSENRKHEKEIKFFEHTKICPTCTQGLGADSRDRNIREITSYIEKNDKKIRELESVIVKNDVVINRVKKIDDKITVEDLAIAGYNSEISIIENTIENFHAKIIEIQSADIEKENNDLIEKNLELEKVDKKLVVVDDQLLEYKTILELLTDGGIKKYIIKKYLPILNNLVMKYIQILGFNVKFSFDEQFKETIITTGRRNLSYGSFSEGERGRMDLAILFAFREFAEIRSRSGTNLLIFDEIGDSNLDYDGWDAFQEIIKANQEDSNVFVISHKGDILLDKFKDAIQFKKSGQFSKIVDK